MIRQDRELLAELARLNEQMAPLALRLMDGTATAAEQRDYAQRLTTAGQRLRHRADGAGGMVVEGQVLTRKPGALPAHMVQPSTGGHDQRTGETEGGQGNGIGPELGSAGGAAAGTETPGAPVPANAPPGAARRVELADLPPVREQIIPPHAR